MKKLTVWPLILFTMGLIIQEASAQTRQEGFNGFLGTWNYTVKKPSQANVNGDLIITKKDNFLDVKFITGSWVKVEVNGVRFERDKLIIQFHDHDFKNLYFLTLRKTKKDANKLVGNLRNNHGQKFEVTAQRKETKK